MQCNAGFGDSMPPLPNVYGTSGKIEPLLDTSLINRFADLPQDGELNDRMPWPFCACQNGLSDASRSGCFCVEPLRLWWPPWLLRPQGPIAVPAKCVFQVPAHVGRRQTRGKRGHARDSSYASDF